MNIKNIKPNPANPRIIKDNKFKQLVNSIEEFPEMMEKRPMVCVTDADGKIYPLGGNMRLRAIQELGMKEIPDTWVQLADEWPEEKRREFVIKDNIGFGEWDWDQLANEWDAEQLEDWGLEVPEIEADQTEAQEDDYEIPDEIQTDIVLGDLFEIGEHRLLCGDSTDSDAVATLLDNNEPYLMVTDPPYGVKYNADWRNIALRSNGKPIGGRSVGKVSNDDNADWRETWALSPSKVCYVWHAGKYAGIVQESLEVCDFEIISQIIWNKSNFAIGRGDYHWKHEPCWYGVKKGSKHKFIAGRDQSTVWDIPKPKKSETGHSTQKHIDCMARPIKNHSGDVYDPFLGSGTTMVASHQLNRKCYGMELDPKYCQVIIDRMLKLDPTLEIKRNGQPYKTAQ